MSPHIKVCFEPTATGDRVRVGAATIDLRLDAIPPGELRELARAGFRAACLGRITHAKSEWIAFNTIARFVQWVEAHSHERSEDDPLATLDPQHGGPSNANT